MNALKEGLRRAGKEPFAIGVLLVFHFAWSVPLYRYIEGHVIEVMSRYPPPELGKEWANLFVYDFLLMMQDKSFALPIAGMLLAYALIRLVMVPALDAGVFNSLSDERMPRGTAFIRGVRRLSVSFVWLYLLRLALMAVPLYWAVPAMVRGWFSAGDPWQLAAGVAPWLLLLLVWSAMLKLLFTYVLFALTEDDRLLASLAFFFRRIVPVAGIALAVFAVSFVVGSALFSASLYWAGFPSVVLYLLYPLIRIWLRVWGIAAQHRYWQAHRA
jgi:hypothetical protein